MLTQVLKLKAKLMETLCDTNHQHQVSHINFYDQNIRLFVHVYRFTLHVHQRAQVLKPHEGSEGHEVIQTETRSQETLLTLREVCSFIFLSTFIFKNEMTPVVCSHQVTSKLTREFKAMKQELNGLQSQLEEMRAEKVMNHKQIADLIEQELRRMNESKCEELTKMNEKCSQLR